MDSTIASRETSGIRKARSRTTDCLIIANNSLEFRDTDIHSYEYPWLIGKGRKPLPSEGNKIPSEVCDQMGPGWFFNAKREWTLKSAQQVVETVRTCNQRSANYLMNVAPNESGLIPGPSVKRLEEIGRLLAADSSISNTKKPRDLEPIIT